MFHLRRLLPASLVLALLSTACLGAPQQVQQQSPTPRTPTFPMTLTDDDGVNVTLEAPPERIVTFAPSITEIVFELGLGEKLVGVSGDFDNYPPEAKDIEHVGGAGEFGVDPNVEKVVSLEPDLFLTIPGGDEWKERVRDLDVTIFTIHADSFDDLLHDILTVGRLTATDERAAELTADMEERADEVAEQVGGGRVSCFFEAFYPPLTTVGPRTFIFDLLERAGCDPVSEDANADYPEWSLEQLVKDDPDVYLVGTESGVSAEAVAQRPGFRALTAVKEGRVELIESDLIVRAGPRVVEGLEALAEALQG